MPSLAEEARVRAQIVFHDDDTYTSQNKSGCTTLQLSLFMALFPFLCYGVPIAHGVDYTQNSVFFVTSIILGCILILVLVFFCLIWYVCNLAGFAGQALHALY